MKILFVSSASKGNISPLVKAQGDSLERQGLIVNYFGIKDRGTIGYLSSIPKLRKFIRVTNPDIIHAHYSLCGFVTSLSFTRIPIVVSLMGSDVYMDVIFRKINRFFHHCFWNKTIVKSREMKTAMNLTNAHIISNGVCLSSFKPQVNDQLKRKFGFPHGKVNILFLADPFRHEKNYMLAKEAVTLLDPEICTLVVRYKLSHSEIPEVLNAADIILLTSKWEGSPNVIKEAMACNRPIVATNVGDIEWLFGNEPGHYISSFEPEDVASKIMEAIEFSVSTGKTNGRNRINELNLESESIAKKIIDVYKSLI